MCVRACSPRYYSSASGPITSEHQRLWKKKNKKNSKLLRLWDWKVINMQISLGKWVPADWLLQGGGLLGGDASSPSRRHIGLCSTLRCIIRWWRWGSLQDCAVYFVITAAKGPISTGSREKWATQSCCWFVVKVQGFGRDCEFIEDLLRSWHRMLRGGEGFAPEKQHFHQFFFFLTCIHFVFWWLIMTLAALVWEERHSRRSVSNNQAVNACECQFRACVGRPISLTNS